MIKQRLLDKVSQLTTTYSNKQERESEEKTKIDKQNHINRGDREQTTSNHTNSNSTTSNLITIRVINTINNQLTINLSLGINLLTITLINKEDNSSTTNSNSNNNHIHSSNSSSTILNPTSSNLTLT